MGLFSSGSLCSGFVAGLGVVSLGFSSASKLPEGRDFLSRVWFVNLVLELRRFGRKIRAFVLEFQ